MESKIEFKIISILSDLSYVDEDEINKDTKFFEDLGLDKFEKVHLAVNLEEEFNINIPDDDLSEAKSVQELINLVKTQLVIGNGPIGK